MASHHSSPANIVTCNNFSRNVTAQVTNNLECFSYKYNKHPQSFLKNNSASFSQNVTTALLINNHILPFNRNNYYRVVNINGNLIELN